MELQTGNMVETAICTKDKRRSRKEGTVIGHGAKRSRIFSVSHPSDFIREGSTILELSDFQNRNYGENAMFGPVYDKLRLQKYYWKPDCSICVFIKKQHSRANIYL